MDPTLTSYNTQIDNYNYLQIYVQNFKQKYKYNSYDKNVMKTKIIVSLLSKQSLKTRLEKYIVHL